MKYCETKIGNVELLAESDKLRNKAKFLEIKQNKLNEKKI